MMDPGLGAVHPKHLELWKTDAYLRKIELLLPAVKLVSFDIFDTLLFRACSMPTDVFVLAAEKAAKEGVLRQSVHPEQFRDIRIKAEVEARKKQFESDGAAVSEVLSGSKPAPQSYTEVTLELIYAQIPASLCDRDRMLDIELETEREICYLNPHAASLLYWCKENQVAVALLSDMYLSTPQLSGILQAAGLDVSQIDGLLISNEHHCGKVSGELFDLLSARFPQLTSKDILHIGDNPAADVQGAALRQISSIHYKVIPEHFDSPFHWDSIRHAVMLPQLKSLRKLAAISMEEEAVDESERFFYQFGAAVIGPFLHGWCEWIIDECIRENRTEVHPLMREAYLLGPMLEQAARMRGMTLSIKPFYVSRQAAYLAAMDNWNHEALNRLFEQNWTTVGDMFALLEIAEDSAPFQLYLHTKLTECQLIADESGETTIADQLREFLLSERMKQKIKSSILRNRKLFVDYMKQEFGAVNQMVTVDIGFNGTMQKAIETALRLSGQTHRIIHLLAVGTDRIGTLLLEGMDIRCFLGSCGENSDLGQRIVRSPAFLEELMMGEFGSTLRYEMDPHGIIKPVLAELLSHTAQEFRLKKASQQGALAFQRYYGYLAEAKPDLLAALSEAPREWSKPLHRAIDMPTPEEACLLGNLTHQDNFCGMQVSPISNPVEDRWFNQGEEAFIDFCNYGPSTFNAFWPQGMVTRKSPYYLYRYYLRQKDLFGNQILVFELVRRVKEDKLAAVHIYGTGTFAQAVRNTVLFHGMEVESFTTSHADQSALAKADEAAGNHAYIIASLSDIFTFRQDIERAYLNSGISPSIYDLSPWV
jgi:predicted HAD superfamily hydrolase